MFSGCCEETYLDTHFADLKLIADNHDLSDHGDECNHDKSRIFQDEIEFTEGEDEK